MIEKIEHNNKTIAIILHPGGEPDNIRFYTPEDNPLQLGSLNHKKGHKIKPHVHKARLRLVNEVQEVLHIQEGEVEAEFFDEAGAKISTSLLAEGDTILLVSGGHGFNILKDAVILEVKQGPYLGAEEDKEKF